jgi:hypothetical protein
VTILLVVDTCALLDLIRSPVREEFTPSYATGARNLLAALKAPQAPARIVCTDVVQNEYQRHVVPVTEETKRFLTQARNKYRQALSVIGGLSAGSIPTSVDDAWVDAGVQHARRLADDFFSLATVDPITQDDQHRAFQRVITATPPSRRGKDSTADCAITEAALRLARAPMAGVTKTVLFSSNSQEYCDGRKLKTVLQAEFNACGLQYVRTWGEACRAILGSGAWK